MSEEINELIDGYTSFGGHQHLYISKQNIDKLYQLIDQLEESDKVVIPRFVAEAFEKAKESNCFASQLINATYKSSDEVGYWLEVPSNEKLLLRAWLDGYEVEEKLYYVKLPNTNSESEYLYLAQGNSTGKRWFNSRLERLECEADVCKHQFTEKEIKDYDERYWQFAVEVTE